MSRHHQWDWVWRRLRRLVFERDGYQCVACGKRGRLECDHIVPISDGGTDDLANLQTLCRACHMAKTDREKGTSWQGKDEWAAFATASRFDKARP